MKYDYYIETFSCGGWIKMLHGSRQYCQGFLDARKDYSPSSPYRLMRPDGKVIERVLAREDVSIGQVAGWPTAEQFERAADKALERAKAIRARAETKKGMLA